MLTAKEAAAIMRVHPYTMMRWCRKKKVVAKKVGGIWRIERESLLEFSSQR